MHDLLQGGVKPSRRNVFSSALGLPLNFVGSRQFAKSFVYPVQEWGWKGHIFYMSMKRFVSCVPHLLKKCFPRKFSKNKGKFKSIKS